jgi:hypothetical protein
MNMNHTNFTQDGDMLLSDSDIDTMSGGYSSAGESLVSEYDYLSDNQSQIGGGYDSMEDEQTGGGSDDDSEYNVESLNNMMKLESNEEFIEELLKLGNNHENMKGELTSFIQQKLEGNNDNEKNRIHAFYFLMMLNQPNAKEGIKVEVKIGENKDVEIQNETTKMLTN